MRIVITGGSGMLARALLQELARRGHDAIPLDRSALDITDAAAVGEAIAGARPDAVIQCAAYTDVDGAEAREEYATEVNALATRTVARACARVGARFVYPSTDYVFDGSGTRPYRPDDQCPVPCSCHSTGRLESQSGALSVYFAHLLFEIVVL